MELGSQGALLGGEHRGGGQRRGFGPPDWTGQELTSSWLAVYLGSYFDRRYHCERGDKLSKGSPWRRCVPPPSCSDSHQALSAAPPHPPAPPSSFTILLEAKDCGGLFGRVRRVCVGRDRGGSGYRRSPVKTVTHLGDSHPNVAIDCFFFFFGFFFFKNSCPGLKVKLLTLGRVIFSRCGSQTEL